jgi:hypothetical protein
MPDIFTAPANDHKADNSEQQDVLASGNTLPEKSTLGLMTSLIRRPKNFHFAHQKKDETISILARRHFITNLLWIVISLFALTLPPLYYLMWLYNLLPLASLPFLYNITLLIFYYVLVFGFAFFNYISWFYNMGIITNKRMVDIDLMHLSYIDIAITQLEEIEDVVHRQKGFFASFFDYGDVVAHTVTGKEDFVFEKIPRPTMVADILSKQIGDVRKHA